MLEAGYSHLLPVSLGSALRPRMAAEAAAFGGGGDPSVGYNCKLLDRRITAALDGSGLTWAVALRGCRTDAEAAHAVHPVLELPWGRGTRRKTDIGHTTLQCHIQADAV